MQRDVEIDEIEVGPTSPTARRRPRDAAGPAPAGPVTSDGATTTITGGLISLDTAMTETSGIIRADTIIADSVVASNYSPGAGNVW